MAKPFNLDRALNEVRCSTCGLPDGKFLWTCRVTADANNIGLFSRCACDDCVDRVLTIVRREYPDAAVYPLPKPTPDAQEVDA